MHKWGFFSEKISDWKLRSYGNQESTNHARSRAPRLTIFRSKFIADSNIFGNTLLFPSSNSMGKKSNGWFMDNIIKEHWRLQTMWLLSWKSWSGKSGERSLVGSFLFEGSRFGVDGRDGSGTLDFNDNTLWFQSDLDSVCQMACRRHAGANHATCYQRTVWFCQTITSLWLFRSSPHVQVTITIIAGKGEP